MNDRQHHDSVAVENVKDAVREPFHQRATDGLMDMRIEFWTLADREEFRLDRLQELSTQTALMALVPAVRLFEIGLRLRPKKMWEGHCPPVILALTSSQGEPESGSR